MYVGRVIEKVQIEDHLKGKFPGQHFSIEKLPNRAGASSNASKIEQEEEQEDE